MINLVKSHVGREAEPSKKEQIVSILGRVGGILQPLELAQIINELPKEMVLDIRKN